MPRLASASDRYSVVGANSNRMGNSGIQRLLGPGRVGLSRSFAPWAAEALKKCLREDPEAPREPRQPPRRGGVVAEMVCLLSSRFLSAPVAVPRQGTGTWAPGSTTAITCCRTGSMPRPASAVPRQGDRRDPRRRQAVRASLPAAGESPPTVLPCVVSTSQLHPGMNPNFFAERPRSYPLGTCGIVSPVPPGATQASLRGHFAPLRPVSYVHAVRRRLTSWHRVTGWLPCFGRENRDKALPYSCTRQNHDTSIASRHCWP